MTVSRGLMVMETMPLCTCILPLHNSESPYLSYTFLVGFEQSIMFVPCTVSCGKCDALDTEMVDHPLSVVVMYQCPCHRTA